MSLSLDEEDYAMLGWGDPEELENILFDKLQIIIARNNDSNKQVRKSKAPIERRREDAKRYSRKKENENFKVKESARHKKIYKKKMQDPEYKKKYNEVRRLQYWKKKAKQNELNRASSP